jgi:ATP-dependent RNA helicase RhlE
MGFSRFNLVPELLRSINALGYAEPTPIQQQAIPEALKGRDIRACAQTGTGKTCAFVIPIVQDLLSHTPVYWSFVFILILTRELAAQITSVIHGLIKGSRIRTVLVLGGVNINQQIRELRSPVDIVVATPGRLLDLLSRNCLSLRHVRTFVLDEADRMLDMGFLPDMKRIRAQLPFQRQTMFHL